jgi:hypothetical protein
MCAMVQSAPGMPEPTVTSPTLSQGDSPHSFAGSAGNHSPHDFSDPSLRWRCREPRCGAAFLTREQLRSHMKAGVHGEDAPVCEEAEEAGVVEVAARERRSTRAPARAGGYSTRGGGDEYDEDGDYNPETPALASRALGNTTPGSARSAHGTFSPEDVNKLPGMHPSILSPGGEARQLRLNAEKEAERLREEAEQEVRRAECLG